MCVCKREYVRERKCGREKRRSKISWWSAPPFFGFFWFLLPQKFFLISCFLLSSRRLCLFRKFDVFVARRVEKKLGFTNVFKVLKKRSFWIEKSASNKRREANATHSRAFKQREQQHIKGWITTTKTNTRALSLSLSSFSSLCRFAQSFRRRRRVLFFSHY